MAFLRKKNKDVDDAVVEIKSLTAWSESQLMWPLAQYHMCNVLDDADTIWNSGRYAPASIRVKLTDGPQHVTSVKLQVEMSPLRAQVHHEIRAADVVVCVKGPVAHGAWIHVDLNCDTQLIEIVTIASPSFVAWKRIRVFGCC